MLEHGGNLLAAVAYYGQPRSAWLDLSTGINPHAYPAPALEPDAWHRLPENDPALVLAAMRYYGAPHLLPVAGTQAAIQALPRLRPQGLVSVAAPAYAEHGHCWAAAGHTLCRVAYADLGAAIADSDVVVVCNPNNPTGETVAPAQLLDWAQQLAMRGGWLIVDEAFGDMTPEISVAQHIGQPGLIVLRSVGKFFGLAGLRLGFVGAHEDILTALSELLGPWTVSGPAQSIGCAALADADWQQTMRAQLLAAGQRLQDLLAQYAIASSGTALFQWWPEPRAVAFQSHMARQAIWVRRFGDTGVRLGLPPHENAWQRLHHALATWQEAA
ncbi:threonine-phosphate decarboxylase CobD [Herbaspirillum sp. RTI4]|uniref:threonine-phosphate decarboxylase CobD n=1 Tax=Herbaspirillum sp. RTI4 TaxID=3048640 RepID=UPI002AB5D7F7|nr:threonine-phosphate decarboxylase CobD [Herbaspirillum sp. RTI4]MDY7579527.1 threonine-phosphate decarboxylase CobD [Herbaspirillum sp. RTI4]MEA9983155.1 threonine-phosphate decarboxylase CobD [Herbaspirillum sp. RTI4]